MINTILLISDSYEIKQFLSANKINTINFEELNTDNFPLNCNDAVIVHNIEINKEKYLKLRNISRYSNTSIFGFDLNFAEDVDDSFIFEYLFYSQNDIFDSSKQIMSHNVSFVPSVSDKKDKLIVGLTGSYNTNVISDLQSYTNTLEYKVIDLQKDKLYGVDVIIITNNIPVLLMLKIMASCKPYTIYKGKQHMHEFLVLNYNLGRQIDSYTSKSWWYNIQYLLQSLQCRVPYPFQNETINPIYIEPVIQARPNKIIALDQYSPYTDKDVHRSGWGYVVNGLASFTRPYRGTIMFDSCIDKSFLWSKNELLDKGAIPYVDDWVGIIHHTFSEHCGPNNCNALFETREFIESLKVCKCIIVLSEYLKTIVEEKLKSLAINVKVKSVLHPTQFVNQNSMFNPNLYDYTVTHIGDFLRNKHSFYELNIPKFKKQILDNSKKTNDLSSLSCSNELSLSLNKCKTDPNITVIGHLNNEEYDELLKRTVVFINLYDASACNTLIECIVRNTPIFVNKHPAVIEYIGKDYPGLYDSLIEFHDFCTIQRINDMHKYLSKQSVLNNNLSLKTFLNSINSLLQEVA